MTAEQKLRDLLDREVSIVPNYWNDITVTFPGPLTYAMLDTVAEFFGTKQIDIDSDSVPGTEVELTVYEPTRNVP